MDKLLLDLFEAYYDARRNKRNTHSQLKFELDVEHNLIELCIISIIIMCRQCLSGCLFLIVIVAEKERGRCLV